MSAKNILFDFDGVILDSMPIRDKGFELTLHAYPKDKVEELLTYHRNNGGLSRYHKLNHFFSNILLQPASETTIKEIANSFSQIMRRELTNKKLLIIETVEFIKRIAPDKNLHIVSGSDGEELRYLCNELGLSQYFITIQGSPTPKTELVKGILDKYGYNTAETLLIGDSKNDYDAATANNILFAGYNNPSLLGLGRYIDSMQTYMV